MRPAEFAQEAVRARQDGARIARGESRPIAVGDPLVGQGDPLGFEGQADLRPRIEPLDLRIEEVERGRIDPGRGELGQAGERIGIGQLGAPDGVPDELVDRFLPEVRGRGEGGLVVLDDPEAEPAAPGFDQVLDLAHPDVDRELDPVADRELDLVRARAPAEVDELRG